MDIIYLNNNALCKDKKYWSYLDPEVELVKSDNLVNIYQSDKTTIFAIEPDIFPGFYKNGICLHNNSFICILDKEIKWIKESITLATYNYFEPKCNKFEIKPIYFKTAKDAIEYLLFLKEPCEKCNVFFSIALKELSGYKLPFIIPPQMKYIFDKLQIPYKTRIQRNNVIIYIKNGHLNIENKIIRVKDLNDIYYEPAKYVIECNNFVKSQKIASILNKYNLFYILKLPHKKETEIIKDYYTLIDHNIWQIDRLSKLLQKLWDNLDHVEEENNFDEDKLNKEDIYKLNIYGHKAEKLYKLLINYTKNKYIKKVYGLHYIIRYQKYNDWIISSLKFNGKPYISENEKYMFAPFVVEKNNNKIHFEKDILTFLYGKKNSIIVPQDIPSCHLILTRLIYHNSRASKQLGWLKNNIITDTLAEFTQSYMKKLENINNNKYVFLRYNSLISAFYNTIKPTETNIYNYFKKIKFIIDNEYHFFDPFKIIKATDDLAKIKNLCNIKKININGLKKLYIKLLNDYIKRNMLFLIERELFFTEDETDFITEENLKNYIEMSFPFIRSVVFTNNLVAQERHHRIIEFIHSEWTAFKKDKLQYIPFLETIPLDYI